MDTGRMKPEIRSRMQDTGNKNYDIGKEKFLTFQE